MTRLKKISMAVLEIAAITTFCAINSTELFAQDSYSSLKPEFSASTTFSSGIMNMDENATVDKVPGLSNEFSADIDVKLKGSFTRASEWGVEKEDGIEWKSGIGYEAGASVDMSKVYKAVNGSSEYNETSDTNHYSLIQPMIDWYEANMSKYGLPYNPCKTEDGSPWPTTKYGQGEHYQFIHGSYVEPADNVNWTSDIWNMGEQLYEDIKYAISSAIEQLDTDLFGTGNVSQFTWQDLNDAQKKKAELKNKARREFNAVAKGKTSSTDLKDAISSAFVKITNIGGAADVRVDFLGKRLTAGDKIFSYLAGQSEGGSAVTVSLKKGLFQGVEADLFTGIAGGENQNPENYDTDDLDYYRGLSGEWALGGKVRYTEYFEKVSGTLQGHVQGIWSDILVANKNFALDAGCSYNAKGFVSYGAGVEAMLLNYKDRTDDNADYKIAYSVLANGDVGLFGAKLSFLGAYKSENFEHKLWTTDDRFYGYSMDSDYYIANAKQAAKIRATLDFNPQYFLGFDVVSLSGGYETFLYGDDLEAYGTGFFGKLTVDIEDFTAVPLLVYGGMNYYKNDKLTTWADYSTLPDQEFVDFTKFTAGLEFNPVKYIKLSAEYSSAPSYSRRNSERKSSFTLNGTLKFD